MPSHSIELVTWQERPARIPGTLPKLQGSIPSANRRLAPLFLPKRPTPPRHIPRLPQEIIHLIIESLCDDEDDDEEDEDDDAWESSSASLARLCLVSKDFLLPSRKALYEKVTITKGSSHIHTQSQLLLDSLMLHPHLAARVRQIRLELDNEYEDPLPPDQLSLDVYLQALLPHCQAVETLTVRVSYVTGYSEAKGIFKALVLLAPSLKNLTIHLNHCDLKVDEEISTLLRLARGLESLDLSGSLTWVGEPPKFELDELNLSQTIHHQDTLSTLTRFSTLSLHTLRISPRPAVTGPPSVLGLRETQDPDVSRFPNLHTLQLAAYHRDGGLDTFCSHASDLPLRHLDLRVDYPRGSAGRRRSESPGPKYLHIPPDLPPTLSHLHLLVPSINDVITFLDSGTCPLLSSATFELRVRPDPGPWTRIAIERAAKERGLCVFPFTFKFPIEH
ncbi:hypothetical protein RQP46_008532 [Phenoliferia psychrophenolica]